MGDQVTTRITRIGNSKGIIVPTSVVKALALEDGDTVALSYNSQTQELTVKFPNTKQLALVSHLHNA
jgi:antitoxin component of MazEF toxin-antitoxin module